MTTLTVVLAVFLNSNAQDQRLYLAAKGDSVAYDSAVVMNLELYRLVRSSVNEGQAFVDSLSVFITRQQEQQDLHDKIVVGFQEDQKLYEERLQQKDSLINRQSQVIENLYTEVMKDKRKSVFKKIGGWFRDNWQGIFVGYAAAKVVD